MKHLLLSLALTGCSFELSTGGGGEGEVVPGAIDRARLHDVVEGFATDTTTPARAVRCPEHVRSVAGASFECAVELAAGTHVVVVTTEDDRGRVDLRWKEPIVGGAWLAGRVEALLREHGMDAGVSCGEQLLRLASADAITCAVDRGHPGTAVVTSLADRDRFRVDYRPARTWNPATASME